MEVMRFHSPYRHWISGLLSELAVFIGFMMFVGLVAYLVALVG